MLVAQFQDDAPPAWLGQWLEAERCELDVRHLDRDDPLPDTLSEHDAVVVLGGTPSATDDVPAVHASIALVRAADAASLPTLGICLGHQVCAVALGGEVHTNPLGRQLGLTPVGWRPDAAADPLLGELVGARSAVHWNGDVVSSLPPDARVLATAPGGEPQAVRFTDTVWGLQLHPEADGTVTDGWAALEADRPYAAELRAASDAVHAHRDELERAWRPRARSFAALAASAERLPR